MFMCETFEMIFHFSKEIIFGMLEFGAYGYEASQVDSRKWHIQRAAEIHRRWLAARLLGMFQDNHWRLKCTCKHLLKIWDMKETKYFEAAS